MITETTNLLVFMVNPPLRAVGPVIDTAPLTSNVPPTVGWSQNNLFELLTRTNESVFSYCISKCKHFIQKIDIYKWPILIN